MNNHVDPEFFKAFDHYKNMVDQYGDDHPITEQAFILTLHYTPEHVKAEMDAKAKELNLLPPPSGYTDDGEPMFSLEDVAKHYILIFIRQAHGIVIMFDELSDLNLSKGYIASAIHGLFLVAGQLRESLETAVDAVMTGGAA